MCIFLSLKPLRTVTGTGHKVCWELSPQGPAWRVALNSIPHSITRCSVAATTDQFGVFWVHAIHTGLSVCVCVHAWGHIVSTAGKIWCLCVWVRRKKMCLYEALSTQSNDAWLTSSSIALLVCSPILPSVHWVTIRQYWIVWIVPWCPFTWHHYVCNSNEAASLLTSWPNLWWQARYWGQ